MTATPTTPVSSDEWGSYPTATAPYHYTDTQGRRAWIFVADGSWWIEHRHAGRWQRCGLLIYTADDRPFDVQQAALRHLRRQPHFGLAARAWKGSTP